MKLTFFRWTLAKCPNLFSIAFSFQEGLLFFNFILLSSFASCDDNHARWSDTCQDFFTDPFYQHKKVRQVAICFILTSFNFNCFKNHCFLILYSCMEKSCFLYKLWFHDWQENITIYTYLLIHCWIKQHFVRF